MEFLLEPDGWRSDDDIFIVGSFNGWKADSKWQMYWDESDRYYKLRQWVRRGKHNYLYATGRNNFGQNSVNNLACDEYEGNTVMAAHSFIAFVYYREFEYGGYDALIGIGAANIFGTITR
jgi:hypothetical protein